MVLFPQLDKTVVKVITIIDSVALLVAFIDYATAYKSRENKFQNIDINDNNA